MSVLVVGLSHRSAPVEVLERVALDQGGAMKLATAVAEQEHVSEAAVLATCNRVEVYAEVDRFHGGMEAISRLLSDLACGPLDELLPHLYVHYDDGAVSHLFHVASGLDSLAVGEGQILGQTREALRLGQEVGTVGPALNLLFQQALRVAKRAHAETDIDHSAPSMVSTALALADQSLISGSRRVMVLGAGSMAAVAVSHAVAHGYEVVVVNRSETNGHRLASSYAVRTAPWAQRAALLAEVDVVISCTGAHDVVLTADDVAAAGRPLALVDLALPHDIEPAAALLDGVNLINLSVLAESAPLTGGPAVDAVRGIVTDELNAFMAARRATNVTPTVVALRTMATSVVDGELARLRARVPHLDQGTYDEVLHTVRRVADKLLHQPTVRIKELANEPKTVSYATALAELFSLDPEAVDAVTAPVGEGERL